MFCDQVQAGHDHARLWPECHKHDGLSAPDPHKQVTFLTFRSPVKLLQKNFDTLRN